MSQSTFNTVDDADGYKGDAAWAPSAGTYVSRAGSTSMYAEQSLVGGVYYQTDIYWEFDTSPLDDTATVTAAVLRCYVISKQDADSKTITMDWYDYGGGTDTSADWAQTGTNAHNSTAISAISSGATHDFTLTNAAANVNLSGITGLRMFCVGQPTGANYLQIASLEHASLTEAQLIVDWTVAGSANQKNMLLLGVG